MHLPATLLLLPPLLVHSLRLPPTAPDALTPRASISGRQTPAPDPHITDFRGWELAACTGENQGVQTVTQSQLGQCLAFPVEVRALTLNRIVEGCTGEWRDGTDGTVLPGAMWGVVLIRCLLAVYLFGEAGCTGDAQMVSAQTSCASVVSSVERWKAAVVSCVVS